jgi:hypothetical protein
MIEQEAPLEGSFSEGLQTDDTDWLQIAQEAYKSSTDYLDETYRRQFEKNLSNFRSRHPKGSKYYTENYKFRSRLFRPKTRSAMRRSEASFSEAMFATTDVITLSPVDQANTDEDQRAKLWQAVLNYRLGKPSGGAHSIPWFLTAVGAFQESKIYGIVCSRQDWVYEESPGEKILDPEGNVIGQSPPTVLENKPRCELLEIENVRFDPGAKWYDPVNTSPYFIELIPMYVGDVMEMMETEDQKTGRPMWNKFDRGEILTYGRHVDTADDTTRVSREGDRNDPKDQDSKVREFEIVWVHRNFIKKNGVDYEFYTLTDRAILSDPEPTKNILGRPYRIGITSIEAHRCIPSAEIELTQDLQAEANDIVNQRLDNVKLVLNKGYFAKRNSGIDLMSLKRSYPGRIVLTDEIGAIETDETNDVTSSSYQEQDRINADIDDMTGGMSAGSVMTNRKLGETVGGMNLMNQSGNSVAGYSVRTFVETWVEPVLTDLVKLIQAYESDENIQRFAQTVGVQIGSREELAQKLTANVSVGFGPLDPKVRAQAVIQSIQALGAVVPWAMGGLDVKAVSGELFGIIGYRDGEKFFKNLPDGPPQPQPDPMVKLKEQEIIMRGQIEMARLRSQAELKIMELSHKEGITQEEIQKEYAKLDLEMDKLNLDIMKEMGRRDETARDREEMQLKLMMGQGI